MSTIITLSSRDKNSIVKINAGELVSYTKEAEELIHQKGDPGWERSDIEMFPTIGPVSSNKYKVFTKKGHGVQDQHGFLRELDYVTIKNNHNYVILQKVYKANTRIKNSMFPKLSKESELFWPFDFTFTKYFKLNNDYLKIKFELTSEKGMPFMFGYHPAFKLSGKKDEICIVNDKIITIQEVIDKGGPSYPFNDISEIILVKKTGFSIRIKEEGFNNIMLWTEYPNMICIEPITQYPDLDKQFYSEENLRLSKGKDNFSIIISPFKKS